MEVARRGVGALLQDQLLKAQLRALLGQGDDVLPGLLLAGVQPVVALLVIPDVAVLLTDGGLRHVDEGVVAVVEAVEAGGGHALRGAEDPELFRLGLAGADGLLLPGGCGEEDAAGIVPDPAEEAVGPGGAQGFRECGGVGGEGLQLHQTALAEGGRLGLGFRLGLRRLRRWLYHQVHRLGGLLLGRRVSLLLFGEEHGQVQLEEGQLQAHTAVVVIHDEPLRGQKQTRAQQNQHQQRDQQLIPGQPPAPVVLVSF